MTTRREFLKLGAIAASIPLLPTLTRADEPDGWVIFLSEGRAGAYHCIRDREGASEFWAHLLGIPLWFEAGARIQGVRIHGTPDWKFEHGHWGTGVSLGSEQEAGTLLATPLATVHTPSAACVQRHTGWIVGPFDDSCHQRVYETREQASKAWRPDRTGIAEVKFWQPPAGGTLCCTSTLYGVRARHHRGGLGGREECERHAWRTEFNFMLCGSYPMRSVA